MIVTEQTLPDLNIVGRQAMTEFLEAYAETAGAFAESQEKLATSTDVEWLSRLLYAQATFTREVADASTKFARDVMEG
jgi:hypothetical protein